MCIRDRVPLYLGVRAVVAKSFARIHAANLINAGIMPLTFAYPEDYDKVSQGDSLKIENVYSGMDEGAMVLKNLTTGEEIKLTLSLIHILKSWKRKTLLKNRMYVSP